MSKRGLEGNKGRKNHFGWDFILVWKKKGSWWQKANIFGFMIGEVYFSNGAG